MPHCLQRAERLRKERQDFFDQYTQQAQRVLNDILDKYIEYGTAEFKIPDILKLPPISERGTVIEIANMFDGAENLRGTVNEMQASLYAQ